MKEGDKTVPVFVLVIHLSDRSMASQNLQSSASGWVVSRRLQDFNTVHEKLVQVNKISAQCLTCLYNSITFLMLGVVWLFDPVTESKKI